MSKNDYSHRNVNNKIIDNWYSGAGHGVSRDEIGFTFNISHYEEGEPVIKDKLLPTDIYGKLHTYFPVHEKSQDGTDVIGSYLLTSRIPPRDFTGIFFANTLKVPLTEDDKETMADKLRQANWSEESIKKYLDKRHFEKEKENTDPQQLLKIAKGIAKVMIENGVRVPIYDIRGNLWWPEIISNKQLQKESSPA
jgi:hypothetical protein